MPVKHKIIVTYTKDLSVEIPDVETLLLARERISKYKITLDITSKPLKNKMIDFEYIIHLRPTYPALTKINIEEAFKFFQRNLKASSLKSVEKMEPRRKSVEKIEPPRKIVEKMNRPGKA